MFKAPFSFEGRIRRTEFGLSYVIYFAVVLLLAFSTEAVGDAPPVLFLLYIPLVWFLWAQGAKRCHDKGNSGWYQIIPFYVFWLLFSDSDFGHNEYGPNPKGIGNMNEIEEIGEHLVE